jgi:hypothetical protein
MKGTLPAAIQHPSKEGNYLIYSFSFFQDNQEKPKNTHSLLSGIPPRKEITWYYHLIMRADKQVCPYKN